MPSLFKGEEPLLTRTPFRPFSRNLLLIDLETTGSDPLLHEVVEVGAVLLDRTTLESLKTFNSFVKPDSLADADPKAMQIHGISQLQLNRAPTVTQVVERFADQIGSDFTLSGWNICFDAQFLASLFRKAGRFEFFQRIDYHKLDLWSLFQLFWTSGSLDIEPKSFSDLCSYFGLHRQLNHRALEDAMLSAEALRRVFGFLER